MKTIKAGGAVIQGDVFITLNDGKVLNEFFERHREAKYISSPTLTFNDDRTLTIKGEIVTVVENKSPIRFKSPEEAEQYRLGDMKKDWRGRLYLPAGFHALAETMGYTATFKEPWFIDFSDYTFEEEN